MLLQYRIVDYRNSLEKKVGIKHKAYDFWKHGEYTYLLLGWKRKEGDVKEQSCLVQTVAARCISQDKQMVGDLSDYSLNPPFL